MTDETAIRQLIELIHDRESFCTGGEDDEIYLDDIEALKVALGAIGERAGRSFVIEVCPHCMSEAAVEWSPAEDGHSLFCPHCGKRIMLFGRSKKMTNFEKIKAMTLEEMSEAIFRSINCMYCPLPPRMCYSIYRSPQCAQIVRKWLESEED